MANDSDSLPPSWILMPKGKNGSRKTFYYNEKTHHCFKTRKDLDHYVKYVKRELPNLYAVWANECTFKEGVYYPIERKKEKRPTEVSNGQSKKKKDVGQTSCIRSNANSMGPIASSECQPVIFDGPFRRPRDKEKVVCTTSSDATTGPSESHPPVKVKVPSREKNLALSTSRGKKRGADGASSSRQVISPGASLWRPTAQTQDRVGWL